MEITALSRAPARAVSESAARASDIALQQSSGRATEKLITTDLWPHGLTAQGRTMRACALPSRLDARGRAIGATVADLIEQEWITALKSRTDRCAAEASSGRAEIAVAVDGRPVARAAWRETPLKGGEIVTLRAALADGGGDKNPLRTILQIGVLVAAIVVPPLLFTATWAQTLAGAAITIAGGLIVNAIAPPILPDTARPRAIEPIYSLSGGANRARAYEPLLLVLGAHRVFPDLGAAEYTEISGDDHVLHQIFNFGLGDLAVDDLRIGTTALDSYEEVETEFGDARGRIALVAGSVDSFAGGALDDTQWLERTTAAGTRRIGVDITGRLFRIDDEGEIEANSAEIEIEWRAPGQATQRRTITLMHDSQAPLRRTFAYDLASAGTWTVRVRRTADPDPSDRVHDGLAWAALRAYQIDDGDYSGQTRLGLRIRATGQLSGRLDRLSAMVRQRVPTWDGARWTAPAATSNPAWLFRWYARGLRIAGRQVAGVGLPDTRIDEDSIKAWGAWCEGQRLGCNLVLDRTRSHAEVLTTIAQCGRASPRESLNNPMFAVSRGRGGLDVKLDDIADRPGAALVTGYGANRRYPRRSASFPAVPPAAGRLLPCHPVA